MWALEHQGEELGLCPGDAGAPGRPVTALGVERPSGAVRGGEVREEAGVMG